VQRTTHWSNQELLPPVSFLRRHRQSRGAAWYATGTSVITVLAMMALPETGGKPLEN
jgi:hypothetical protein